jgi:hypothetical protein
MKRRWWIYALVGLVFGVIDWYYLDLLASLARNPALNAQLNQAAGFVRLLAVVFLISQNYGIWLVPVIPVAIIEVRRSGSVWRAAAAAGLTWAAAMVGYYGYYAILLLFAGLPGLEFMLYSNHLSPEYWTNTGPLLQNLILGQFLMWVLIALITGPMVGALTALVYKKISTQRKLEKAAAT